MRRYRARDDQARLVTRGLRSSERSDQIAGVLSPFEGRDAHDERPIDRRNGAGRLGKRIVARLRRREEARHARADVHDAVGFDPKVLDEVESRAVRYREQQIGRLQMTQPPQVVLDAVVAHQIRVGEQERDQVVHDRDQGVGPLDRPRQHEVDVVGSLHRRHHVVRERTLRACTIEGLGIDVDNVSVVDDLSGEHGRGQERVEPHAVDRRAVANERAGKFDGVPTQSTMARVRALRRL